MAEMRCKNCGEADCQDYDCKVVSINPLCMECGVEKEALLGDQGLYLCRKCNPINPDVKILSVSEAIALSTAEEAKKKAFDIDGAKVYWLRIIDNQDLPADFRLGQLRESIVQAQETNFRKRVLDNGN